METLSLRGVPFVRAAPYPGVCGCISVTSEQIMSDPEPAARAQSSIARHPDIQGMRNRSVHTRASYQYALIGSCAPLLGAYMAISPWVVGFSGEPGVAASNVAAGVLFFAVSLVLTFAPVHIALRVRFSPSLIGLWMVVSPWVISGKADVAKVIANNAISGAVALMLGQALAFIALAILKEAYWNERAAQDRERPY
ncbi:SPW repeat protein [Streptomyces sp. NPDC007808]|uniref:SPW repeat protein n=1 Tax=Streptomyces sp. NPDC007808 TaxID=3364779 RepID=UPI003694B260